MCPFYSRAIMILCHCASQMSFRWFLPVFPSEFWQYLKTSDLPTNEKDWNQNHWKFLMTVLLELQPIKQEKENAYTWIAKIAKILRDRNELLTTISTQLENISKLSAHYIVYGEDRYPAALYNIPDPPIARTVLGDITWLNHPNAIAIIGSRNASQDALDQSFKMGQNLAKMGVLTISGGAYGCDISAHRGCIESNVHPLPTLVVLAGGLNHIYPKGNIDTFRKIYRQGGALISERLCSSPSRPFDFPIRNRIISGLSQEIVVMEARMRSGALVTARYALDQGKEVSVYTGNLEDVRAAGCETLHQDGALGFKNIMEWSPASLALSQSTEDTL